MAQVLQELLRGKRKARILVHVSIKTNKKPATRRAVTKKGSRKQKAMCRKSRRTYEAPAKRHRARRRRARRSGPLRGVRRQQRKRVRFHMGKRALPAFFLFMAKYRPQLQRSNPHWTATQTVKELGNLWHEQSEKDKKRYKAQAARLRRRKQKRRA